MEHDASCTEHRLLACGVLPAADFTSGSFQASLRDELSSRERERKKDAAKGFQRTPAFVHAVVLDVLEASKSGAADRGGKGGRLALGGFSDVGQHTGSEHRATAWPLVCQTIQVSILWWLPRSAATLCRIVWQFDKQLHSVVRHCLPGT
jgi:hypothetical protein